MTVLVWLVKWKVPTGVLILDFDLLLTASIYPLFCTSSLKTWGLPFTLSSITECFWIRVSKSRCFFSHNPGSQNAYIIFWQFVSCMDTFYFLVEIKLLSYCVLTKQRKQALISLHLFWDTISLCCPGWLWARDLIGTTCSLVTILYGHLPYKIGCCVLPYENI